MSTRAVTPDAPAASTFEPESHPHAEFLPTGKEYRMTGKLPDADTAEAPAASSEENTPEKEEAPAASKSDTAAASEAATTQKETKEEKQKTSASSESRWAKVTRENKELRERLQRLESQRETKQEPRPATGTKVEPEAKAEAKTETQNPKPKIDDVDPKTGKPKFSTYQEYLDARDEWNRKEAIREFQEASQKSERERAQSEAEKVIEKTVAERVAKARETYPDYDDVIKSALAEKNEHGEDALFYTKGSHIDGFFLDSDRGQDVMYEIAKNFGDYKHIFARDAQGRYLMNPVRQVRELAKIELALESAAKTDDGTGKTASSSISSAKPITQAPRPPHQTSGKGTVNKDAVAEAIEDGDFETYAREQNARDLARRKKGK